MKTEITLKGQKDLMSWLDKHSEDVKNDVRKLIFKTGNNIRTDWMKNLEKKIEVTKETKQSIQHRSTKGGYGGEVYSGLDALTFIEYGTKPHRIKAKHKPVLADVKQEGKFVVINGVKRPAGIFGKEVWHPGTQPKPCLTPAAHKHLNKLTNDLLVLMRSNK